MDHFKLVIKIYNCAYTHTISDEKNVVPLAKPKYTYSSILEKPF